MKYSDDDGQTWKHATMALSAASGLITIGTMTLYVIAFRQGQQAFQTILGAIGGAIAGHQVEKKVRATKVYEVRVRMEDGSIRSVNQTTAPSWRSGDRVRLEGGNISLNT
jgi:outer membrane lipoprotein SlyB